ncbi:hypothetical protein FVE85_1523 [Porphyridium purpureum]|uniref:Uncharacterized protein n=1 Tax=Porphyridium purpureum TaxID=35688 RepID=A0A5J4YW10_PORPP|nr:hypothetical protein FVE85_1523 [Porphyridium purpureum]|eukprot:POR9705..scf209_3
MTSVSASEGSGIGTCKGGRLDVIAEEMGLEGLGEIAPRFTEQNVHERVALAFSVDDLRTALGTGLTVGERKRMV